MNHYSKTGYNDFYNSIISNDQGLAFRDYLIQKENLAQEKIDYLEFGVFEGTSLTWWLNKNRNIDSRFFGFDTFNGLPEDWGCLKKGTFQTANCPQINDPRCKLLAGLFQDTLNPFLQDQNFKNRLVVYLDADLYSSTTHVLNALAYYFRKDDILIFDEFCFPMDEFLAFREFAQKYKLKYEFLGASNNYMQVALKVISLA